VPLSPRRLGITGPAQRRLVPPGTPQVVKVAENKQNIAIADARALALHEASVRLKLEISTHAHQLGRPSEARLLLLQLRQADASVVHNPYWWIARARIEEEVRNTAEVISLYEQALKECHASAYAMVRGHCCEGDSHLRFFFFFLFPYAARPL
jgi:hypothetical protein